MITVITNENMNCNPYPGMSLAEACSQLTLETEQAVNEFTMNILLAEHAYLYENGVEMEYFDEAGNDTKNGITLKERALDFITRVGLKISELWDKLVEWVFDRIDDVTSALQKAGITKKHFDRVLGIFDKVLPEGIATTGLIKKSVDFDGFMDDYTALYDYADDIEAGHNVYDSYVYEAEPEMTIDKDLFKTAGDMIFTKNDILATIRRCKKAANHQIEIAKKRVKAIKSDDMNDELKALTERARYNSTIAKESIKIYHQYVSNMIAIVREVFKNKEIRKELFAEDIAAVKAAPGKAYRATMDRAGRTAEGVRDKAATLRAKMSRKKEDVEIEESAYCEEYEGKYFRV